MMKLKKRQFLTEKQDAATERQTDSLIYRLVFLVFNNLPNLLAFPLRVLLTRLDFCIEVFS